MFFGQKEQKVSEFRQAWIDELRKCLVSYLVNINAISDAIRSKEAGIESESVQLIPLYKALNEAHHGVMLRLNEKEAPAKRLIEAIRQFELLAQDNQKLIPENILEVEAKLLRRSKQLLKFEWKRVKRGEETYVWSRRIVVSTTLVMIIILFSLLIVGATKAGGKKQVAPSAVTQPLPK